MAGAALLLGACAGYFFRVPARLIAGVMAFGSGVVISALSFELMDEAYKKGGFGATAVGFLAGAGLYTLANWLLTRKGAKHRKRSGGKQPSEKDTSGSGAAIAVGALLDGNTRVDCHWPVDAARRRRQRSGSGRHFFIEHTGRAFQCGRHEKSGALGLLHFRNMGKYRPGIGRAGAARLYGVSGVFGKRHRRHDGTGGRRHPGHAGRYHDSRSV